jgi:hypothetical protein
MSIARRTKPSERRWFWHFNSGYKHLTRQGENVNAFSSQLPRGWLSEYYLTLQASCLRFRSGSDKDPE